jgi:hypothetical protein
MSENEWKECPKMSDWRLPCEYRESPDNTVSISTVPCLTPVFFLKEIAWISPFNTSFIRKIHFLRPEIQIKDPFFSACDT